MATTVKISAKTHRLLRKYRGKRAMETGKDFTFDQIIQELVYEKLPPPKEETEGNENTGEVGQR